ncbi:MAG: hypothetical protein ACKVPX_07555 [Myxococcaceae bacterium]
MTLRNRGEPSGFSKMAAPLLAAAMRRANRKDLAQLKSLLEACESLRTRKQTRWRAPSPGGSARGGTVGYPRPVLRIAFDVGEPQDCPCCTEWFGQRFLGIGSRRLPNGSDFVWQMDEIDEVRMGHEVAGQLEVNDGMGFLSIPLASQQRVDGIYLRHFPVNVRGTHLCLPIFEPQGAISNVLFEKRDTQWQPIAEFENNVQVVQFSEDGQSLFLSGPSALTSFDLRTRTRKLLCERAAQDRGTLHFLPRGEGALSLDDELGTPEERQRLFGGFPRAVQPGDVARATHRPLAQSRTTHVYLYDFASGECAQLTDAPGEHRAPPTWFRDRRVKVPMRRPDIAQCVEVAFRVSED